MSQSGGVGGARGETINLKRRSVIGHYLIDHISCIGGQRSPPLYAYSLNVWTVRGGQKSLFDETQLATMDAVVDYWPYACNEPLLGSLEVEELEHSPIWPYSYP